MLIKINTGSGVEVAFSAADRSAKALQIDEHTDYIGITYGYLLCNSGSGWAASKDLVVLAKNGVAKFYNETEGSGTFILIDKQRQQVAIFTDPYRLYCLYVLESDNEILVSTSLLELRKAKSLTFDTTALACLLVINCTLGKSTLYNEVKTLEEGCCFTLLCRPHLQMESQTGWAFPLPGAPVSAGQLQQAFYSHVHRGLQLSDHISLALTSGLDSRATLAASLPGKQKLHTYTHGFSNSMDVSVARKLAKRVQVQHAFYDLEKNTTFHENIPRYMELVNSSYEGSLNALSHAHAVVSYTQQAALADTFFSSFGGELLRSYYLPVGLSRSPSLAEIAEEIRKMSEVKTRYEIFERSEKETKDTINDVIYQQLKLAPQQGDAVYLTDYYYHRRNFNSVTTRFAGKYFKVFNPYFSRDIYTLAVNSDTTLKRSGKLQQQLVMPAGKALTHVLINNKIPLTESAYLHWLARYKRLDYITKVLTNKLTNRWYFRLYFTDYDNWIKSYHSSWASAVLAAMPEVSSLDTSAINAMANDYLNGTLPFTYYKSFTNLLSTIDYLSKSPDL